jgi:hypothetical protein
MKLPDKQWEKIKDLILKGAKRAESHDGSLKKGRTYVIT